MSARPIIWGRLLSCHARASWRRESPPFYYPSSNRRIGNFVRELLVAGPRSREIAHFLIQCLFSMFAKDADLLPSKLFQRIVGKSAGSPEKLTARLGDLFKSMQLGGDFMLDDIWF